jgi:hypothetical protein
VIQYLKHDILFQIISNILGGTGKTDAWGNNPFISLPRRRVEPNSEKSFLEEDIK